MFYLIVFKNIFFEWNCIAYQQNCNKSAFKGNLSCIGEYLSYRLNVIAYSLELNKKDKAKLIKEGILAIPQSINLQVEDRNHNF